MGGELWEEVLRSIRKKLGNDLIQHFLDEGLDVNSADNNGTTMLIYAAECGNMEVIEFLLQNGAHDNITNHQGATALHLAAQFGHKDIVQLFITRGTPADICDIYNNTPLHYIAAKKYIPIASRRRYHELIHFLVDSNADINAVNMNCCTPVLRAAQTSSKHIVELFIKCGANINCCDENNCTVLHHASKRGWSGIVRLLLEGKCEVELNRRSSDYCYTPLMFAIEYSHKGIFNLLIEYGANINCQDYCGQTALHYAAGGKSLDIVKSLVCLGCDINANDCYGLTPLLHAAEVSNFENAIYLIESGADVDSRPSHFGSTALHYVCGSFCETCYGDVCENHCLALLKCLIKKECDLNAQDTYFHDTPLHYSALYDTREVTELLLKAGADSNIENKKGQTPFYYIIQFSIDLEHIKLFLKYGACIKSEDYDIIINKPLLKEGILQDVQLCTQAVINKFNNSDHNKMAQDITEIVKYEIQTNGYCNVINVLCPTVLNNVIL